MNLSLEERMISGDQDLEFGDLTVLIHENDNQYFDGMLLDFVRDHLGKGRFQLLKA